MKMLNKKTSEFFFMGFREKFLLENTKATNDEIEQAFQKFKRDDELFETKFKIVKIFVALGVSLKYIAPGAVLAGLAIYFGINRFFLW